jgi:Trypsin
MCGNPRHARRMKPTCLLVLALGLTVLAAWPSRAIVLLGGDTAVQRAAPANGAPWSYVAQLDDANASGVYLGKRFILTANHVNYPQVVRLNGQTYALDVGWGSQQIDGDDLKLIRIATDPGLAKLPLIAWTDNDLGKKSTMIGWGLGNGEAIPGQGWKWSTPRLQRWGTNVTLPAVGIFEGQPRLVTAFNFGAGPDEASIANTDSGGALFQKFNTVWKLAGIIVDTDANEALYDRKPEKPGNQPSHSYYIPIKMHRATIKQIMVDAVP